ncbi:MAG: hypothetical protein ACE5JO_09235, partial [Candidatus Binatia bacterium]
MLRQDGMREKVGACWIVILLMACISIRWEASETMAEDKLAPLRNEGLKVGVFDFKANGSRISPKILWEMKKALMKEIGEELGWQVEDLTEKKSYVELVKGGYQQALAYGVRYEVDLLVTTHLYLLQGEPQPFIHFYLIDPTSKKSRQINQDLPFKQKWFSKYPWIHLSSLAKWENEPTFPLGLRKDVVRLLSLAAQDLSTAAPFITDAALLPENALQVHVAPHGVFIDLNAPPNGTVTSTEQIVLEGFVSDDSNTGLALDLLFVLDSSGSLR